MEGTSFIWRPRTRIVAFGDLALTTGSVIWASIAAILAVVIPIAAESLKNVISQLNVTMVSSGWKVRQTYSDDENAEELYKEISSCGWVVWTSIAITLVLSAIQAMCIVKLIQSTDRKNPVEKALKCTLCWLYFNPVYVLVPLATLILYTVHQDGTYILAYSVCVVYLCLRLVMFYVVFRFNRQLKIAIGLGKSIPESSLKL